MNNWSKIGRNGPILTTITQSYFSGSKRRCKVSSKSNENCDHRSHGRTDRIMAVILNLSHATIRCSNATDKNCCNEVILIPVNSEDEVSAVHMQTRTRCVVFVIIVMSNFVDVIMSATVVCYVRHSCLSRCASLADAEVGTILVHIPRIFLDNIYVTLISLLRTAVQFSSVQFSSGQLTFQ